MEGPHDMFEKRIHQRIWRAGMMTAAVLITIRHVFLDDGKNPNTPVYHFLPCKSLLTLPT